MVRSTHPLPRRRGRLLIAAPLAVLALAACSGDDDGGATDAPPTTDDLDERGITDDEPTASDGSDTSDDTDGPDDAGPATIPIRDYVVTPPRLPDGLVELLDPGLDGAPGPDDDAWVDTAGLELDDFIVELDPDEVELDFIDALHLVEHGVEQGVWTAAEGTIAVLRIEIGEAPASTVDGWSRIGRRDLSSLLYLADKLADEADTTDVERAELERLVGRLIPDEATLDALIAVAVEVDADDPRNDGARPTGIRRVDRSASIGPGGADRPASTTSPAMATPEPDPRCRQERLRAYGLDEDDYEELKRACWFTRHKVVEYGGRQWVLRVLYLEEHERFAEPTLEALERTIDIGSTWTDARIDTNVIITPLGAPEGKGWADFDLTEIPGTGIGGFARQSGSRCFVEMRIADTLEPTDAYRQVVAHEQVHCLQTADYGRAGIGASENKWYIEGGAEYLSHVVYPTGGVERTWIGEFRRRSLTTPITEMAYELWPWWQYLGNRTSPGEVFALHGRMHAGEPIEVLAAETDIEISDDADIEISDDADIEIMEPIDVLAAEPDIDSTFHDFTIDIMRVGIPTMSTPIPPWNGVRRGPVVDSVGTETVATPAWTAVRFGVAYDDGHRFTQTDLTAGVGRHDMADRMDVTDRGAWGPIPAEVVASCGGSMYILALTTITGATDGNAYEVTWSVDDMVEEECDDPCVARTWLLDNESFIDTVFGWAETQGGGFPPGFDVSWGIVGNYYARFEPGGRGVTWRNDWQMVFGGSAQGMDVSVITSITDLETFRYNAGEDEVSGDPRIRIRDSVVIDSVTTVDVQGPPGLPVQAIATPGEVTTSAFGQTTTVATPDGGGGGEEARGTYTCTPGFLTIAFDEAPDLPMRWFRAPGNPTPPPIPN